MKKFRFGSIHADYYTMREASERICEMASRRQSGFVVTPNVDHVVMAEKNQSLRAAYSGASLSLVDGQPLVWLSRFAGHPLPEKISGSDLVFPVIARAAEKGLSVFLLGAAPGVAETAARRLVENYPGLPIAGLYSPPLGFEKDPREEEAVLRRIRDASPHIVLVALGCPKQELLMHRWQKYGLPMVFLGIGATLDFIAGNVKRAPKWMSRAGLEWVFRIGQDPKRLIKRYLVQDVAILGIVWRVLRTPKEQRVFEV